MTVETDTIEFLAYCLMDAPGIGAATLRTILQRMEREHCDAEQFLGLDDRTLQSRFELKREAVAFLRSPSEKTLESWQTIQQRGISVLVRGQPNYPERINRLLAETAPPILYVLGNLELLQNRSVGFCGSRKASDKGLKVVEDCSQLLAKESINVISGYAHGIDLAAHKGALEAGGSTTFVLAEGILNFRVKEQIQSALGNDSFAHALIISEFPPGLTWKAHNAMTRNRTICGLSDALVVIESGLEGGTFEAGKTALDLKVPLFCVEYAEPSPSAAGNPYFLQHGAMSLKRARNGQPNLSKILAVVNGSATASFNGTTPQPQLVMHEQPLPRPAPALQPEQNKMTSYPKRLIEVDLPIKRISAHARREKSIRHGHISTLHIWWARRPLAACRAVICASLWPDPADEHCPAAFIKAAGQEMQKWTSHERQALLSEESRPHFEKLRKHPDNSVNPVQLRTLLLDFIADFANWDNSTVREYLDTSRALTQAAHEALGGEPGTRPLVVDPFAGGGSIPLEALRVGADAFASDLNPVPVLLNKVVLEYIPKYGQRLADEVRKWGEWIKREAEKELAEFYPRDADGATPIAYLWARTIQCEGPGCGAEVPLIRSLWLAKKANRSVALQLVPNKKAKRVDFKIIVKQRGGWVNQDDQNEKIAEPNFDGTVKRGSATCPCCGYTTPVTRVREQLKIQRGGGNHSRLMCVVSTQASATGRFYRQPTETDLKVVRKAESALEQQMKSHKGPLSFLPNEKLDLRGIRHTWGMIYGHETWTDHFSRRQLLALTTITRLVRGVAKRENGDASFHAAVATCLALNLDKLADLANSLCPWEPVAECPRHLFSRQAIPFTWDFGEGVPIGDSSGSWQVMVERFATILAGIGSDWHQSSPQLASATAHPLPDDSANALVTDPPYYDAVPYAYLSDFFYVWLRRNLFNVHPDLFRGEVVPKDSEIVVDRPHELSNSTHDIAFYERELAKAFGEGRRVVRPDGVSVIVFASKTTASWEAILKAVVDAGWIITGSWPIDTEMETRVAAQGQARLASSVHLVCRPRENPDGSMRTDEIGDWRDVLQDLPRRIHEWMPRLAEEGVVGADAIFACLGPALEIFSRYSRVEKASGEAVTLKEYLEQVWAAVAKEALTMIFTGADTTGFEEDARLTAMWLWTLNAGNTDAVTGDSADDDDEDGESEGAAKKSKPTGFVLEYDAARKIAQGLGAHLEDLSSLVEISGETARLLPVGERARHLFGKDEGASRTGLRAMRKKKEPQMDLFKVLEQADEGGTTFGETKVERHGETVLDRIHQSMILFAAGRSEALKRFLVEDGAGRDQRFWRLAQALSALYPSHTGEKRWVDGVLARKKGLGF